MRYIIDPSEKHFHIKPRLLKFAKKAEDKFFNNMDRHHAKFVNKLLNTPVVFRISTRMTDCYGTATQMGPKKDPNRELELAFTEDIEIYSYRRTYEIVSHELAHCFDFIIRGDSFHDEPWRSIHRRMGGTGETFIDVK